MPPLERRRFLQLSAAATATALAGCLGTDEKRSYTDWIPTADDGLLTAYADFAISTESEEASQLLPLMFPSTGQSDDAEFVPTVSGLDETDDLCLTVPLEVGGRVMGGAVLSIAASGLGYLVDPERPTQGTDELFVANDVVVGTGDIDTQRADERLKSGTEDAFGQMSFEVVDEHRDFTIYQPTTGDTDAIIAVSEDAVLVGRTRDALRTVIDTERGDHGRATDNLAVFEWLVETAGAGHFVVGWTGPANLADFYFGDVGNRPGAELVTQQDDCCSSVTFAVDDDEMTADFALRDSDLDGEKRDRLDARLGTESDDREIEFDSQRVSVSGTYSTDVLDIEFSESGDGSDDDQFGETPPEVENAVPDGAFEFSYNEEQRRVRVDLVKEFEAERVAVQSVEAGGEISTADVGAINSLYVRVDPEGDEVVVTVTVDGETGPVARTEIP
ncbi:hypothetical protein [Halovenus marina]|uniref:hypothetical protein n=1 Tax=Halovenus marina TaxID=3396621 RepID=UPI003F57839C